MCRVSDVPVAQDVCVGSENAISILSTFVKHGCKNFFHSKEWSDCLPHYGKKSNDGEYNSDSIILVRSGTVGLFDLRWVTKKLTLNRIST